MWGVGMDLIEIDEVRESIEARGERYLRRVFTSRERDECGTSPTLLAERFAAKEAILKALLVDQPVPWAAIETTSAPGGRLSVRLSGAAAALADRRGVERIDVSVSREADHAAAVAVTEGAR